MKNHRQANMKSNHYFKTDEWFHSKGIEGKRMLLANARSARPDLNLQRKRVSQDFNDQFANRKRKSNWSNYGSNNWSLPFTQLPIYTTAHLMPFKQTINLVLQTQIDLSCNFFKLANLKFSYLGRLLKIERCYYTKKLRCY